MPVGVKFLGLLVVGTVVFWLNAPLVSAGVLFAAAGALASSGVPMTRVVRLTAPFVVVAVVLAIFQALIGRWEQGLVAGLRLVALAMVAMAVTVTTAFTAVADAVERGLTFCRLRPDRVFRMSLLVGIALRSIDHLGVVARHVLDAREARGLGRSVRAFAVPTVIGAARFAHGVGEALDARGISDPEGPAA